MKKAVGCLWVIALIMLVFICLENWIVLEPAYKRAIRLGEASDQGSGYLLCEYVRVTGYDWFAMQNESGEPVEEYIRISGQDPLKEGLSYDLLHGSNAFVLYYDGRNEYYDEAMKQAVIEYAISDWDILYPVKRDFVFLKPKGFIVMSDLAKPARL